MYRPGSGRLRTPFFQWSNAGPERNDDTGAHRRGARDGHVDHPRGACYGRVFVGNKRSIPAGSTPPRLNNPDRRSVVHSLPWSSISSARGPNAQNLRPADRPVSRPLDEGDRARHRDWDGPVPLTWPGLSDMSEVGTFRGDQPSSYPPRRIAWRQMGCDIDVPLLRSRGHDGCWTDPSARAYSRSASRTRFPAGLRALRERAANGRTWPR